MSSKHRKLDLRSLNSIKAWSALFLGTFLGSGLLPKAPGTWGSLAALPLCVALQEFRLLETSLLLFLLFCLGSWAAAELDRHFNSGDLQQIVVDEVLGMAIATLGLGPWSLKYLYAFGLFRLFDIWKPFPIRFFRSVVQGSSKKRRPLGILERRDRSDVGRCSGGIFCPRLSEGNSTDFNRLGSQTRIPFQEIPFPSPKHFLRLRAAKAPLVRPLRKRDSSENQKLHFDFSTHRVKR